MKKLSILLLLLFVAASACFAQTTDVNQLRDEFIARRVKEQIPQIQSMCETIENIESETLEEIGFKLSWTTAMEEYIRVYGEVLKIIKNTNYSDNLPLWQQHMKKCMTLEQEIIRINKEAIKYFKTN